jgi:hypothetical protein
MLKEKDMIDRSLITVQELVLSGPNEYRIVPSFRVLVAALNQGWQVEEPVQVLPSARTQTWIYYFTLINKPLERSFRLLIPADPEVESFVGRNQFQVIEGSFY